MDLKDRVVLITGSSQGIGKETALEFAKQGANVAITYNKNKKQAEEIFKECNKLKEAFLVQLDVTDSDSIKKCIEKVIDKFGAIDILINNAGVAVWKNFSEQSDEDIEKQIDVNLKGLIKITKQVLPYLKAQGEGIVINIGSGAGKTGIGGLSVYSSTKFAVRGLTQALEDEFTESSSSLRFYTINPGMTSTKMTDFSGISPKKVAEVIVNTAKENINKNSGEDIDVWDYA